jgi:hypothetical protein
VSVREHALAPWILDVQLNPGQREAVEFRRERTVIGTLDDATWIASDRLCYLRPELVLAHEARLARPVDDADLVPPRFRCSTRPLARGCATTSRARGRAHHWRRVLAEPRRRASGPAHRATNALR